MRTLDDLSLDNKTVFVRADFNVTVGSDQKVSSYEDYRIESALPTLQYLRGRRCRIVLATHFGRPKAVEGRMPWDMEPVRRRLVELIGDEVGFVEYMGGPPVKEAIKALKPGGMVFLPNLRLDAREEAGDKQFAAGLVEYADLYVNEAFSSSHRAHASLAVAPTLKPACAGRRTVLEVERLEKLRVDPEMPYVAVVSGAKITTKIGLLRELLKRVDEVFLAGQIANVFLQVRGKYVDGKFHQDDLKLAADLWEVARGRIVLPVDLVVGPAVPTQGEAMVVLADEIPSGVDGVWDIGPAAVEAITRAARASRTFLWNGPVGRCEVPPYNQGTVRLAKALADIDSYRVVGGGDTVNVLEEEGLLDRYTHVSVGGGALVAYLEGRKLPGLKPLYG